jgi:hypothetical protein
MEPGPDRTPAAIARGIMAQLTGDPNIDPLNGLRIGWQ